MVEMKIALWKKKTYHLRRSMAGEIRPHSSAYECLGLSTAISVSVCVYKKQTVIYHDP